LFRKPFKAKLKAGENITDHPPDIVLQ